MAAGRIVRDREPRSPVVLARARDGRHERGNIAPKVEAPERPPRSPDPWLRALDVLDDHRDMPACRFASLALDAKACIEQAVQAFALGASRIGSDRRGLRLRARPRHRHVGIFLARRRCDNQRGIAELRAVERQNVLDDKPARVAVLAIDVALDVKAKAIPAFGDEAVSPAADAATKVY